MKMASRSIDPISTHKKKQIARAAHFLFSLAKKTNLRVQHAFLYFFAVVLHNYNAVL